MLEVKTLSHEVELEVSDTGETKHHSSHSRDINRTDYDNRCNCEILWKKNNKAIIPSTGSTTNG